MLKEKMFIYPFVNSFPDVTMFIFSTFELKDICSSPLLDQHRSEK